MRFLLCGIGSIGQRHFRNLRSLGHEVAVLRSGKNTGYNSGFLEKFFTEQAKAGSPVMEFTDFDDAIRTFEPDGVFITNPNVNHLDTAFKAAGAGKHLFIEKPVAITMDGVEELQMLVAKNKLTVMVGYNFRFHPLLKRMKEIFDSGAIGKALSAHVEMGESIEDWHPWEDYTASYGPWEEKGGGAVLCFSHDVDYLYWFLGMPDSIVAVGGKMTPLTGDAEDMVKSLWTFRGGAVASVHLDYWQRPHRRNFHLVGTEGSLLWDYEAKCLMQFSRDKDAETQIWTDPEGFERNTMFIDEVKNFIEAIGKKTAPGITLGDGIDVLRICMRIKEQLQ